MEKQEPSGIYVIYEGRVKLSMTSAEGKTLILKIANPGEVLGLTAALSGCPYEGTAEALESCQVAFVRRQDFLHFLVHHPEVYRAVMGQLASHYLTAFEKIWTLGLHNATEKLASFLLEWSEADGGGGAGTELRLTHEQIAEFIGTTRETVTRTLGEFRSLRLAELRGSTLIIEDRAALEKFAGISRHLRPHFRNNTLRSTEAEADA
jgi:CRP/FNR family transcriptional regulator